MSKFITASLTEDLVDWANKSKTLGNSCVLGGLCFQKWIAGSQPAEYNDSPKTVSFETIFTGSYWRVLIVYSMKQTQCTVESNKACALAKIRQIVLVRSKAEPFDNNYHYLYNNFGGNKRVYIYIKWPGFLAKE